MLNRIKNILVNIKDRIFISEDKVKYITLERIESKVESKSEQIPIKNVNEEVKSTNQVEFEFTGEGVKVKNSKK